MIISRETWGARHPDGFRAAPIPAQRVWLHHSVTIAPDLRVPFDDDDQAIRTLERIGQQNFGGGISYTFPVTPVGRIYEGHSINRQGAHTAGHNTTGRAICLVGDYEDRDLTPAQMDAVVWLLLHGRDRGWWVAAALAGGHRDVKATACPGLRAYRAIPEINRRAAAGGSPTTDAPAPPRTPSGLPRLAFGQRGPAVAHLQRFMIHVFPSYNRYQATGYYGPQTKAGVAEFQARSGIRGPGSDGTHVGPQTNRELARHGYR